MNVYHASYHWQGAWGAFRTVEAMIVANTEAEALGFALTEYDDTYAAGWTICRVDTTAAGCTPIWSASS